jgi:hypothetical protein
MCHAYRSSNCSVHYRTIRRNNTRLSIIKRLPILPDSRLTDVERRRGTDHASFTCAGVCQAPFTLRTNRRYYCLGLVHVRVLRAVLLINTISKLHFIVRTLITAIVVT